MRSHVSRHESKQSNMIKGAALIGVGLVLTAADVVVVGTAAVGVPMMVAGSAMIIDEVKGVKHG